jgi:hypothetical protein
LNVTTEWSECVASDSTAIGDCEAASPQIRLSPSATMFVLRGQQGKLEQG